MSSLALAQEAIRILNQSGLKTPQDTSAGRELTGPTAVIRTLYSGDTLVAYHIGSKLDTGDHAQADVTTLLKNMKAYFSLDELRDICFNLEDVDFEDIPGRGQGGKARELILYMQRRARLDELVAACQAARDNVAWGGLSPIRTPYTPTENKLDVGVILSVARPAFENAAIHLEQNQLDANFVLLTNVPDYGQEKFLSLDDNWEETTRAFARTLAQVRRDYPESRLHFFFAAPAALTYALGCTQGTVYGGDCIYHWDNNGKQYFHIATISNELRG